MCGTTLNFSRDKAKQAQQREVLTTQPKESLTKGSKASIEVENYLGGIYYWTVDEVILHNNIYRLIESKHSKKLILPSEDDIKDGLLKMILYSNIDRLCHITKGNTNPVEFIPALRLTSVKMKGNIHSKSEDDEIDDFIRKNKFNKRQTNLIEKLFKEADKNNFQVIIECSK